MVGIGLLVDLGDPALLRADGAGEVAEVVGRQRDVGRERLAHRLAVLAALGDRQHLEVLLDRVGDRVQHGGPLSRRPPSPVILSRMGRVERKLDVLRARVGDFAERLTGRRCQIVAVLAGRRRYPLAADEVLVALVELHRTTGFTRCLVGG